MDMVILHIDMGYLVYLARPNLSGGLDGGHGGPRGGVDGFSGLRAPHESGVVARDGGGLATGGGGHGEGNSGGGGGGVSIGGGRRIGPGRHCSPRHRISFNSMIEPSKCVSGVDEAAGNGPRRYCSPRRRMPFHSTDEA